MISLCPHVYKSGGDGWRELEKCLAPVTWLLPEQKGTVPSEEIPQDVSDSVPLQPW